MTVNQLYEWIESEGWKPGQTCSYDSYTKIWYKRFPDIRPGCACNLDKPGIQMSIQSWDHGPRGVGFQVEVKAEPSDGIWVELIAYSLNDKNLRKQLDIQVKKLIRAWKAVNA